MRIAVNGSILDCRVSGLGIYARNLLSELTKLHDNLVVYTSSPEVCGIDLTKIRRISERVQPSVGSKGHFQRIIWTQSAFPLRLLKDRVSLLLSPLPEGMLLPVVPQVVTVLDIIPIHFPKEYPWQQYYFRYYVPNVLKKSRGIVAISESTKRDIITTYDVDPEKVYVILPGCDRSRYRLGIDTEEVKSKYGLAEYILYLGNLMPHKNLRNLLRGFALIAPLFAFKLIIVGWKDRRYYPDLKREVESLGLTEKVLFLDYVHEEELPALYAGATAFVLPSLYEGFGLPALEAMACGCPVVASRVSSLPEVCGDAALYVNPHEVESIADGIYRMVMDEKLRKSLINKAMEREKLFNWRKSAEEHIKIFEQVLRS